jgi:hypothetical protein
MRATSSVLSYCILCAKLPLIDNKGFSGSGRDDYRVGFPCKGKNFLVTLAAADKLFSLCAAGVVTLNDRAKSTHIRSKMGSLKFQMNPALL